MEPKSHGGLDGASDDFPEFQVGGFLGELSTVTFSGVCKIHLSYPSRKLTDYHLRKKSPTQKNLAATWMSRWKFVSGE